MLGELLLGHPLFPGETSSDQIEQIARIMGPPAEREVRSISKSSNTHACLAGGVGGGDAGEPHMVVVLRGPQASAHVLPPPLRV